MPGKDDSPLTAPPPSSNETAPLTPKRGARWKRVLFWGGAILIAALVAVRLFPYGHNAGKTNGKGAQKLAVAVATAVRGDMPVIYQLLGTVVPIANVTITPRVNGYIMKVAYKEGQHVTKGDELELIDPRPYEAALEQAQGTLAADQAQLAKARVDNGRYQRLIRQNSTSAMTAKDQEFTVKQLEGQVKYDEGQVRTARLNLMYCHIIAPVTGRVGIRNLDIGNYVAAGQSGGLTTLTQMQPISVIFTLPQNDLPLVWDEIRSHDVLTVEAWDSDNLKRLATGTTRALDSQIDTATGTVRLRGIFANENEELFPNEFVNAHLLVKTLHGALMVPGIAVQASPDGTFVYVVGPDMRVQVRPIKTGYADDTRTVVLKGLEPNEKVVTDGIEHLKPGAKVFIAPSGVSAAAATPQ